MVVLIVIGKYENLLVSNGEEFTELAYILGVDFCV